MAAEVTSGLTQAGIEVLAAPGESTHIDFVNSTSYEGQLEAAGKAYLDWYMLTQVRGPGVRGFAVVCAENISLPKTLEHSGPRKPSESSCGEQHR